MSIQPAYDSIDLDFQNKYRLNGLTQLSNNINVIPRNDIGDILLYEDSKKNPILIIEPIVQKFYNDSFVDIIDTQFKHYKFPVRTIIDEDDEEIDDIDFDELNLIETEDPIFARYKPSENIRIQNGYAFNPITQFLEIDMSEIESGLIQKNINKYYITKEIKESGADLRFRVKIEHRFDGGGFEDSPSAVAFSIIKDGPNYSLNRVFKGQYSRSGVDGRWSFMKPYEVWITEFDQIITNEEFEIGDNFSIGADCSDNSEFRYHTIAGGQAYWVITDADKNVDEWNRPIDEPDDNATLTKNVTI